MPIKMKALYATMLSVIPLLLWYVPSDALLRHFMPHIYCENRDPKLVPLDVIANFLIFCSYVIMTFLLVSAYKYVTQRFMPFKNFLPMFGVFILLCGLTHAMNVIDMFLGYYWLSAVITTLCAIASVFVVVVLVPSVSSLKGMKTEAEYKELQDKYYDLKQRLDAIENKK